MIKFLSTWINPRQVVSVGVLSDDALALSPEAGETCIVLNNHSDQIVDLDLPLDEVVEALMPYIDLSPVYGEGDNRCAVNRDLIASAVAEGDETLCEFVTGVWLRLDTTPDELFQRGTLQ
jgi:hypothetical protein